MERELKICICGCKRAIPKQDGISDRKYRTFKYATKECREKNTKKIKRKIWEKKKSEKHYNRRNELAFSKALNVNISEIDKKLGKVPNDKIVKSSISSSEWDNLVEEAKKKEAIWRRIASNCMGKSFYY